MVIPEKIEDAMNYHQDEGNDTMESLLYYYIGLGEIYYLAYSTKLKWVPFKIDLK